MEQALAERFACRRCCRLPQPHPSTKTMARITEEKPAKVTSASLLSMLQRTEDKGASGAHQSSDAGTEDRAGAAHVAGRCAGERNGADASACTEGTSNVAAAPSSRKRRDMTNGGGFDVLNANHEREQADEGDGERGKGEGEGEGGGCEGEGEGDGEGGGEGVPRELTAAQRMQAEADIRKYFEDKRAEAEAQVAGASAPLYAGNGQVTDAGAAVGASAAKVDEETPAFMAARQLVDQMKSDGNEAFRARAFPIAIAKYEEALRLLEQPPLAASAHANHAAVVLRCNRAMALLKLERFADAVAECGRVLVMDPRNTKALFRQAQGYKALKKYARAVANLELALSAAPEDPEICDLLDECEDLMREQQRAGGGADAHANTEVDLSADVDAEASAAVSGEATQAFLDECRMRAANEFEQSGCIQSQALVSHGHSKIGLFRISGAFQSAEAFGQACDFIKRQHVLASAQAVCLMAQILGLPAVQKPAMNSKR
eukprot:jgi/Mesvir1/26597/Mv09568-RA.1